MRPFVLILTLVMAPVMSAAPAVAQQPSSGVAGVLRIAGSPDDAGVIARWVKGFHKSVPEVEVVTRLNGPDSTMAWLYTGQADLALLERELKAPVEHMAFTWVYQYPETKVVVAHAGYATSRLGAAMAVFVNAANPTTALSLAALNHLYGGDGPTAATWGDLGATGAWASRPVHLYGPDLDSAWALSWRHAVLHDSYKWNAAYRELAGPPGRAVEAVADDPDGITFGPRFGAGAKVRAVDVASADGTAIPMTRATLANGTYPLGRPITMVLNRAPGTPLDPKVQAFLTYVLSPDGQADIAADDAYVPLDPADLAKQQAKLK